MVGPNDVISRRLDRNLFTDGLNLDAMVNDDGTLTDNTAVNEYWTEERMARAQPVSLTTGPRFRPSPLNPKLDRPLAANPDDTRVLAVASDTRKVPDTGRDPYASVGKLFMTFGGEDAWGTAWLAEQNVVVTAGHCVYDHRRAQPWADKLIFVARFGGMPAAPKCSASVVHLLRGWHERQPDKYNYDLAAVTLTARAGQALGWVDDLAAQDVMIESIGYPHGWLSPVHDFDGSRMWACRGNFLGGQKTAVMVNNMTEGCSGGPWLVQRDGRAVVAGINSYRSPDHASAVQSPRFGRGLENLLAAA